MLTRADQLPRNFTDLLSVADVDGLVTDRGLRSPFFRMVRDASPVAGVSRRATAGSRTIQDLADPEALRRHYDDGATLVLQSLHRLWPPIGEFCRALAAELGHPTQCNAYVTPPGHARGFAYHHDTHDVFVLQVDGRKRWQVHRPVVELPTTRQRRSGADLVVPGEVPLLDVELEAGDALYLPRGFVHAAETTQTRSVHLTVGVHPITWYDVLSDVVGLAADELTFRHALPVAPRDALAADPGIAGRMVHQAAEWLAALPAERATELIAARLDRAVPLEPLGMLAHSEAVARCGPGTRTRPRRGLGWSLGRTATGVRLTLPDRTLDLPVVAEASVRQLLSGPCGVGDVVSPDVDLASAVVLTRRLLREGALVVVT